MARLIDADELLKDNTWEWFDDWGNYTLAGQAIADAPTVDAAPVVHGEWKPRYHSYSNYNETVMIADEFCCSCCGVREKYKYNYCPSCGTKMDGGVKE